MAKSYEFSMWAHPSIYDKTNEERKLNIYFSEPENGVNEDTGIVLCIAGFGGNAKSKVYTKMRDQFADKHNLITVQCDYFGWQFMQDHDFDVELDLQEADFSDVFTKDEMYSIFNNGRKDIGKFMEIASKYDIAIPCEAKLGESLADFNDMGIMQAIDNITAVLAIIAIINDNGLEYNKGKIIIYGHSHGAYLGYLCNAFAPNLFSMIIDNSAWLFPGYLDSRFKRRIINYHNEIKMQINFNYLAKQLSYDTEILSLPFLYKQFKNNCDIISFHGISDEFNNFFQKKTLCSDIEHNIFRGISEEEVDGEIIKATNHGLGADFLKFFDFVLENYPAKINKITTMPLSQVHYKTEKCIYEINYNNGGISVNIRDR